MSPACHVVFPAEQPFVCDPTGLDVALRGSRRGVPLHTEAVSDESPPAVCGSRDRPKPRSRLGVSALSAERDPKAGASDPTGLQAWPSGATGAGEGASEAVLGGFDSHPLPAPATVCDPTGLNA